MPRPDLTLITSPPSSGRWRPRPALPGHGRTLRELHALRGMLRTLSGPGLDRYPRTGHGAPVLLIPGFLAGDRSLARLAAHLADAGYDPQPARIAHNVDCSEATTAHLIERLDQVFVEHGRPVALIGHQPWRHAGPRARPPAAQAGLRRDHPRVAAPRSACAQRVAARTRARAGWRRHGGGRGLRTVLVRGGACCAAFRGDLAATLPPGLECLSIYSRSDGIVDWRACLDPAGRHAEVHSSHCGMAGDLVAMHVIERALARLYPHAGPRSALAA